MINEHKRHDQDNDDIIMIHIILQYRLYIYRVIHQARSLKNHIGLKSLRFFRSSFLFQKCSVAIKTILFYFSNENTSPFTVNYEFNFSSKFSH